MSSIQGRLALITGASSGIGRACARRLAADGVHLAVWARRRERLDALAAELAPGGIRVHVAAVDVRDRGAVVAAAEALVVGAGVPDFLVNSAGLAAGLAKLHEGDPGDWDLMLDTNVKGLLNVSRAILPHMVRRGSGHVVNLGSTAGHQVYPQGNVYNASKFAVRAINEGMNVDLAGTGVKVSSVDPGYVLTEFADVRFKGDRERAAKVYEGFRALDPEDVADVVAFVLSLPAHVNILELRLLPAAQRNQYVVERSG